MTALSPVSFHSRCRTSHPRPAYRPRERAIVAVELVVILGRPAIGISACRSRRRGGGSGRWSGFGERAIVLAVPEGDRRAELQCAREHRNSIRHQKATVESDSQLP